MELRFANIKNQKIAYYAAGSLSSAILFIHGNSCSGTTFKNQLEAKIDGRFGVIALDLPGHGKSDPAGNSADYSIPGYARIVAEFIDHVGINEVILVGWSLGGHIALEACNQIRGLRGVLIYGSPPLCHPLYAEKLFFPHSAIPLLFQRSISREQSNELALSFLSLHSKVGTSTLEKNILQTRGEARFELGNSIQSGNFNNEAQIARELKKPLAILHGADEQLIKIRYLEELIMPTLWRRAIQVVKNAGHAIHLEQPERFNELLERFLCNCNLSK